jgi:hypothetical protein
MFDHYTFGAEPSERILPDISFSPTDNSFPPSISSQMANTSTDTSTDIQMSAAPFNVDDIMRKLREQTLQPCEDFARQPEWTTRSIPSRGDEMKVQYPSHRAHYSLPNIHLTAGPRTGPVSCRRLQRQLNVQLQSSKTHMRDVKALVEDMVMTNSQCVLRESASRPRHARYNTLPTPPPSRAGPPCDLTVDPTMFDEFSPSPSQHADEGFHDGEEAPAEEKAEEMFVYRRACAPGGIRKSTITAEYARGTDHIVVGGRVLMRSKPRMRKRSRRAPPTPE